MLPRVLLEPVRTMACLLLVLLVQGCGATLSASTTEPRAGRPSFAVELVAAMDEEATRALTVEPYLRLLDRAIAEPEDPQAPATLLVALDALLEREIAEVGAGLPLAAAFRSREGLRQSAHRLQSGWTQATGPAARFRPLLAAALHRLALRVGDVDAAILWRARSGCLPAARLLGPVAWPPLLGLDAPSAVASLGEIPASVPGVAPFAARAAAAAVSADGCAIDVNATSPLRGVRLVVVDLRIPHTQTITVALTSSSAAVVELGGARLLERPVSATGEQSTLLARAEVEAGRARLVARVGQNSDGQSIVLSVWDEQGAPLGSLVPLAGEEATARARSVESLDPWLLGLTSASTGDEPSPRSADASAGDEPSTLLAASALLALGRSRDAAARLALDRADRAAGSPPDRARGPGSSMVRIRALLELRATALGRDLGRNEALTALQAAAERVLASGAPSWEARIARAAALGERAGHAQGVFVILAELGVRASDPSAFDELEAPALAFAALRASRADLPDVVRTSYEALARRARGSALLADVDARIHRRHGAELAYAACEGGASRADTRCLQAHLGRGDYARARTELRRLRALRGSPHVHQDVEIASLLAEGQLGEALDVLERMAPGTRTLSVLGAVIDWPEAPSRLHGIAREALGRYQHTASDAPFGLDPLGRLLGAFDDPTATLERSGRALCARDRADAFLPGAGTAVLRRLERYELDRSGLLRYRIYDLRRVSGTTDVAEGAAGAGPSVEGRSVTRTIRKRIHKRDGREIDPDPRATGAQGHTELAQLEAGDYVEVLIEGWALPDDSGQIVVDTPDLLPPRTSVREAEILFRRPSELPLSLWTHPLLGPGETSVDASPVGEARSETRWRLRDRPPRRVEEGEAPLEARVGLSFGTDDWTRIARSLGDRQLGLDDRDPYVREWLRGVVGTEPLPLERKIARVVAATGRAVHEADPDALSDFVSSLGGGPQRETARTILEQGRGSRSWVVHRALRELGIPSRIAVSEVEPFSAAPDFPPRAGRFRHPLVVVEQEGELLWIDADVSGPPLPPGRVSPELRGRLAMLPSGELLRVEGTVGFEPDQIDLRLKIDPNGDAAGTFAAVLHGRVAQRLGEDFRTTVGSERDRLLRNVVLGWFPFADVTDMTLSSEEGSWQLAVRANLRFVGFGRPQGRDGRRWSVPGIEAVHRIYPSPEASTLGARHASQAARTSDLRIDEPLLFRLHRRLELPEGAQLLRSAPPLVVRHPAVSAERRTDLQGSVIEESFHLNLPAGVVSAAEFDVFADELRRIDDGFAFGIAVRAPAP